VIKYKVTRLSEKGVDWSIRPTGSDRSTPITPRADALGYSDSVRFLDAFVRLFKNIIVGIADFEIIYLIKEDHIAIVTAN